MQGLVNFREEMNFILPPPRAFYGKNKKPQAIKRFQRSKKNQPTDNHGCQGL